MKTICNLILGLVTAAGIAMTCSAADGNAQARLLIPGGAARSENLFSDWTYNWTNLTVKAPVPAWESHGVSIAVRAVSPAAQQALNKLQDDLWILIQEEKRERLLRPQRSLVDVYRVSLSRATNTVKVGQ